jgi:hypothetical protein
MRLLPPNLLQVSESRHTKVLSFTSISNIIHLSEPSSTADAFQTLLSLSLVTSSDATAASVSNVEYIGNTITGATSYGIVITQDYENAGSSGVASNSVPIKNIRFSGATTIVSVTCVFLLLHSAESSLP